MLSGCFGFWQWLHQPLTPITSDYSDYKRCQPRFGQRDAGRFCLDLQLCLVLSITPVELMSQLAQQLTAACVVIKCRIHAVSVLDLFAALPLFSSLPTTFARRVAVGTESVNEPRLAHEAAVEILQRVSSDKSWFASRSIDSVDSKV
jgi:hypothetical protein